MSVRFAADFLAMRRVDGEGAAASIPPSRLAISERREAW